MARISIKKGLAGSKIKVGVGKIGRAGGKIRPGAGMSGDGGCTCESWDPMQCTCEYDICDPDVPNKVAKGDLVSNPVSKLKINVKKRVR